MPIKRPFVVGISGGSGSGKTFILKRLLDHFRPEEVSLISQDHYYLPIQEQHRDDRGEVNFDNPQGIDSDGLYTDICSLCQGKTVKKLEYSFNNPSLKPGLMEILPAPLIIVEGLFVFYFEKIASLLDYRIFVSSQASLCLERRLQRDFTERALTEEQVRYQWEHHVKPAYQAYLLPYRESSDYILENTGGEPDLKPLFEAIDLHRGDRSGFEGNRGA